MKYQRKILLTAIAICLTLSERVFAQATQKYSLQEAIDYGVKNSTQTKNAALDYQISKATVKEIRSQGLPQVNLSASVTDQFRVPNAFLPNKSGTPFYAPGAPDVLAFAFGVNYTGQAALSINQLLFDGTFFLGLRAAQIYSELAQKSSVSTEINVKANIAKAYYGVLVTTERAALLKQNIIRIDSLLKQTQEIFSNGLAERIDTMRLKVTLNNLKTDYDFTERTIELSKEVLKYQMGLDNNVEVELTTTLSEVTVDANLLNTETPDYKNRIEYSILETQLALDKMNIKQYKVGRYPSLYLTGTPLAYNTGAITIAGLENWYRFGTIGLSASMPLFDGFRKQAKIESGKLKLQKTENQQADLKRAISVEQAQAKSNLELYLSKLSVQEENIALAKEVQRVANEKYKQGVGSSLEVLEAITSYKEAETNYFSALYNVLTAKTDYEKATGILK
jgi:outer membrane protein TolC